MKKNSSRYSFYKFLSFAAGLGVTISLPIVGGVLVGVYLDKKFGSAPKLTLSLLFLGVFVAFANIWNIVRENRQ